MGRTFSKIDTVAQAEGSAVWPAWARRVVTLTIVFHVTAVLSGALSGSPSSDLERRAAALFSAYYQAIDQGYTYRYYAPEPGPTPVVTALIRYGDGRPEETVRLPARGAWPRLRYQRQLAMANHLTADFREAQRSDGDGLHSPYAVSFARHLARSRPGCASVTLFTTDHLIPDPRQVREAAEAGKPVDIDGEEFYTVPERIGEFPCDAP